MKNEQIRPGCFLMTAMFCFILFGLPGAVFAHKVTVFAWLEGDTVFTQSKLSGGKGVTNGEIKVYDGLGTLLLEGKTNDNGEFSFKIPAKPPLIIKLNAGMGHMAKWTLQPEDIGEETTESEVSEVGMKTERQPAVHSPAIPAVPADELEMLIEKVLDKKLKPIKKMLVDSQHKDPSLSEVLGGIGYIIGLVGIATYFRYRKTGTR